MADMLSQLKARFLARFIRRVGPPDERGCTPWIGKRVRAGYGVIFDRTVAGKEKQRYAHRLAWELARAGIPPGMSICHRCDNPPCVNVEHLFLGSHKENMLDAKAKRRMASGDRSGTSKVLESDLARVLIFRRLGMSAADIARKFNVSRNYVYRRRVGVEAL